MSTRHPDGVYPNLPEDEYHDDDAVGGSTINLLRQNPSDFYHRSPMNPNRPERKSSTAQEFGRALHMATLESRQKFSACFVRRPDGLARLDAKAKEKYCPNGEVMLDGEDYDRIITAADLIAKHPELAAAFEGGMPEVSVFWPHVMDDGFIVRCKARFDFLKPRGIGDLKSIRNYMGRPFAEACARAIVEWRYDLQAAHYLEGRSAMAGLVADGWSSAITIRRGSSAWSSASSSRFNGCSFRPKVRRSRGRARCRPATPSSISPSAIDEGIRNLPRIQAIVFRRRNVATARAGDGTRHQRTAEVVHMNTVKTKPIEHDEVTGEVLDTSVPALIETGMVATLVKAELDTQISTAKQYPRSLKGAIDNIMSLATLDEQTAADCMYAMPRGGKPIRGPQFGSRKLSRSSGGTAGSRRA